MRRPRVIVHAPRADAAPGGREVEVHGEVHALAPLGDAVNGPLHWQQPAVFRREWRLVSDRGVHLILHGRRITRRKLEAETAGATWTLSRSWLGEVSLADAEGRELASIPHGMLWRWRFELPNGTTLAWRRHWSGDHTLEDAEGHELLRIVRRFAFFRFQATVELADATRRRDDLLVLLAATFYAWLSEPRGYGH